MRNWLALALFGVAFLIGLAGCGSGIPESGPGPAPAGATGELKPFEGSDTSDAPVQPLKK